MRFFVRSQDAFARAGELVTDQGSVATPAFMPVATQATVKGLSPADVIKSGTEMVIMNTYHLWLRPGPELVAELGGLHAMSRIGTTIVTDSGGFQAFSLADRVRQKEDGFLFSSHLDGTRLLLSPEESMRIQGLLGSDIAMPLDVCPPAKTDSTTLKQAVETTTRWAQRCLASKSPGQALFGIVQGGTDVGLRVEHARRIASLDFDGLALGGFSVGEPTKEMHRVLDAIKQVLDPARPHYLMGVGTPEDLLRGIAAGIDMFDCVLPTRNGRNGQAFVPEGRLSLKNARFRRDSRILQEGCRCTACAGGMSRAYLRHLLISKEMLALRMLSEHNLTYYQQLMRDARQAIEAQGFEDFCNLTLSRLSPDSS